MAENIDFLNTNKAELAALDVLDNINTHLLGDPSGAGIENSVIGGTFYNESPGIPRQTGETLQQYLDRIIINAASNLAAHGLGHLSGK